MNMLNIENKKTVIRLLSLIIITATLLLGAVMLTTIITVNEKIDTKNEINSENPQENDNRPDNSIQVNADPSNTPPPTKPSRTSYIIGKSPNVVNIDAEIRSKNTILVELDSYQSIVEKGADDKMYPASMTKVMTLIVACENIKDLNEKLTVTQEIADYMKDNDGSGAGLKIGESYMIEDLLYLISYQSDTIACLLIADHVAGSEENFVALMNKKANDLNLNGTHFTNCTGLYNEDHYTTCRDMAAIMAYALDNELAYKCLSSYRGRSMVVGGVNCTFYSNWYSGRNRFADNPNLKTSKVVAGKTGYTDESGITLVSVAKGDNGKTYINVIVGLPVGSGLSEAESTKEVKYIYNTYIPAK